MLIHDYKSYDEWIFKPLHDTLARSIDETQTLRMQPSRSLSGPAHVGLQDWIRR